MIAADAVWFITGCSKGFGRSLAEQALSAGYRVVATARRAEDVEDLASRYPDRVLTLALDVTNAVQIDAAVASATERFGAIDVLVNNAGYIYLGAIEEGEEEDVRALFETNLFAPVALIKAVLPTMRARRKGHIVNISSIGGLITFPGSGYYNMVKAGVEALSDVLAKEVGPLAETAGKVRTATATGHGKQAGDPDLGAKAIIAAVKAEKPPVHLLIGGDALDLFRNKLDSMREETDAWEVLTRNTDFQAT